MKKALFLALIIVGFLAWMPNMLNAAEPGTIGFTAKLGLDAIGEVDSDYGDIGGDSETGDIKNGFSLAFEGLYNLESFQIGLGASYLLPRGVDEDWPDGKFSIIPVYLVANILFAANEITPFLAIHLGYSTWMMDSTMEGWYEDTTSGADISTEGGLYWAIGGGILFSNNVQIELLYRSHSGKIKAEGNEDTAEVDETYTHITLSVGYRF